VNRPDPAAPPLTDVVHPGTPRASWCTACKAWSGITGEVLLLDRGGVTVLSTWSGCPICVEGDHRV